MNDDITKKVICIVGPTASGKTELAFDLSHVVPGEMVNADSKQVYKGIDILPGKDLPPDAVFVQSEIDIDPKYSIGFYSFDEVRLWLLDTVPPSAEFSVHDYTQVTHPVIEYIHRHNRIPILVGGSGFYVRGIVDGIKTLEVLPNQELRDKLNDYSVDQLQSELRTQDPAKLKSMNESDVSNPRRLIRAIEVARSGSRKRENKKIQDDVLMIGLKLDRDELKKRIDARVERRIQQGVIEEVKRLYDQRGDLSHTVLSINGVQPLFEYLEGRLTKEEALEKWKQSEYLNAKKQMTWFGKDTRIKWFEVSEKKYKEYVTDCVFEWLNKYKQ